MAYSHPNAAVAIPHLLPKIILSQTQKLQQQLLPIKDNKIQEHLDKIVFVSTWNTKCGIALYTEDLYNELNKLYPNLFMINPIKCGVLQKNIKAKLTHLQHEFSIIPNPPPIKGKIIMTWHTIPYNIVDTINIFESRLDIVAHIIPCEDARKYMKTSKDVYTVSLGSRLMPKIKKEDARAILNIENIDIPIGFVFGFQSVSKNYKRLVQIAKKTNMHLIISGSIHDCGYKSNISNNENVTMLDRYLTDAEIDLYSLASDILLFDYVKQEHYSSSSALHRTIGSGRPIICADTMHFSDIEGVPKFKNQEELKKCIKYALDNPKSLERKSFEFAKRTSRENMAKRHIEIYKKYIDI